MGLFSKLKKRRETWEVSLEFDAKALNKKLVDAAKSFYDFRKEESHKDYTDFIEGFLNLEILNLAKAKELTAEAYAYNRGRIDSLKALLSARATAIVTREQEKKLGAKQPGTQRYMKSTSSSGHLAI